MKEYLLKLLINSLAVFITAWLFDILTISNFTTAITVAIFLSFFNTFLRPALIWMTIPFTIFTLGIFILVINAGILLLTSKLVPGFHISSFSTAFWFSIVMSLISSLMEGFKNARVKIYRQQKKQDDENKFDDYEEIK